MSAEWYKEQPSNRNFLNPIGYLLKLEKFEGVDFFCQSANVPDISMPTIEVASPFRNLPITPGGGVTFGDFSVRFIVDEDLKNYYSIHSWMRDVVTLTKWHALHQRMISTLTDNCTLLQVHNTIQHLLLTFVDLFPVVLEQFTI